MWTHIEDTRPVARKPHQCYLCGLPIGVGERHVRRYGISEGHRLAFRMHEDCEQVTRDHDWYEETWLHLDEAEFRTELQEWRAEKNNT